MQAQYSSYRCAINGEILIRLQNYDGHVNRVRCTVHASEMHYEPYKYSSVQISFVQKETTVSKTCDPGQVPCQEVYSWLIGAEKLRRGAKGVIPMRVYIFTLNRDKIWSHTSSTPESRAHRNRKIRNSSPAYLELVYDCHVAAVGLYNDILSYSLRRK